MKHILLSAALLSAVILISAPLVQAAGGGQHHPNFLKQIGLSETQMQQIDAIKKSGVDKKEKKHEIMALLTQDQKKELKTLKMEWKASHEAGGTTPTTSGPAPAPTVNGQVTPLPGVPVTQ